MWGRSHITREGPYDSMTTPTISVHEIILQLPELLGLSYIATNASMCFYVISFFYALQNLVTMNVSICAFPYLAYYFFVLILMLFT